MRVLACADKLRGTLDSVAFGAAVEEGAAGHEVTVQPMADGGEGTLDAARSWSLVKALITETDVEYIFINRSVQKLLKRHALAAGEDPAWLDTVFQVGSRHPSPIVRHAWGHDTHMHVRFYNPKAQAMGCKAHDALLRRGAVPRSARRYVRRARSSAVPPRRLPPVIGAGNGHALAGPNAP